MTLIHTKSLYKYNDITEKYMDNTYVNQTSKRPDRHGSNNPMYGRTHSQQSKEKMSQAATLRNQQYKQALDNLNKQHITMADFLSNNPTVKEYLTHLVRHQIQEMLIREKEERI